MSRCCSKCGSNGHNSRTCGGLSSSSGGGSGGSAAGGGDEIILFGVRMKVEPMRKSVSMNNLSQYEQPNNLRKSFSNSDESAKAADDAIAGGYASADDAVPHRSTGGRERKRGVPWTEEEHKLFLLGLQKVGKGDWRGISRNFVKTRTPTQVASHAQKYYLRRNNLNRRRSRTSLFDITTDTVTGKPREEGKSGEDNTPQAVLPATSLPPAEISNLNGFAVAPYPVPVGPILVPVQVQNPLANMTIRQADNLNNRSTVFFWPVSVPSPVIPVHNSATPPVINLNQRLAAEPSPLSWRLSLSSDQSQSSTRPSAFQVMQSFNNGDNIITVA